ncbi:MAG TPA: glycosyltransferase family 2 protein [Candidatus Scybalocola faecipullorum]|nr:glycosyltransferase family 2 protein [Candidatus Scybalocola faecipullorum]
MSENQGKIKVSVIVPVYNAQDYLEQCIVSILEQTLQEIEVICVDDSSTDRSLEILKKYEKEDSRMRVLTQPNSGAGAARNRGLSQASGEYLSFLDADDFFEPDMLELAYAKAKEDRADMVVFKSDQYHTDSDQFVQVAWTLREKEIPPYTPFNHRQMTDNIFKVFVGWAWDKLFSREFVEKHHLTFQEQRTSNDMLFVFSAVALAKRITIVPKVLAHQRRDAKDSLSKTRENSWHCFYDALTALRQRLTDEGLFPETEKDFINYALHFSLWNLRTLAEPTKTKLGKKLVSEWFNTLGISGKKQGYFYKQNEYKEYTEVLKTYK